MPFYKFCQVVANKFLHKVKWFYREVLQDLRGRIERDRCRALKGLERLGIDHICVEGSVTSRTTTSFADLVGIDCGPATSGQRSDCRTLLASSYAANEGSSAHPSGGGQLVAMFGPEAPAVLMAIADATPVRVPGVAVPVPEITTPLG